MDVAVSISASRSLIRDWPSAARLTSRLQLLFVTLSPLYMTVVDDSSSRHSHSPRKAIRSSINISVCTMPGNSRTATRAKAKRGLVPRDADLRRSSRFGVCTSSPPLDLPVELVEWIARYLEFKDVLSARIACKGLHACTNTAFGRVALSERSFLLVDPSSMQTLYDISVHPVYSHWVKCIRFSIASLQTPSSDHMQRIHVLGWAKTRQDRLACRDYARQHAALYRKHAEFKPECRALLSKILSKFLKAGNAPGIVATGTETEGHRNPKTRLEGSRPFGIGKLTRAVRYERW